MNALTAAVHPLATVFPALTDSDYAELKASISAVGLLHPVVLTADGQLLDGVHRRRACQELGIDCPWVPAPPDARPLDVVVAENSARRHLTESQRALVASKLAKLGEGRPTKTASIEAVSQADAAAAMGVGRSAVQRAAKIEDDPVLADAVEAGVLKVSDAASLADKPLAVKVAAVDRVTEGRSKTARSAAIFVEREIKREAAVKAMADNPLPPNLHVCSIADLHRRVDAGSVDAIVTDPPYLTEHVEAGIYSELGAFAVHALRPGGLLLAIVPHLYIDRVIGQVRREGLPYRWLMAFTQPDAKQQIQAVKVSCMWKPWAAFTRAGAVPDYYARDWVDGGRFDARVKDTHEWGQKEAAVAAVLREWTPAPGVFCDPFCGGGSFLAAARAAGHQVIGADIDPANVSLTRDRLAG